MRSQEVGWEEGMEVVEIAPEAMVADLGQTQTQGMAASIIAYSSLSTSIDHLAPTPTLINLNHLHCLWFRTTESP